MQYCSLTLLLKKEKEKQKKIQNHLLTHWSLFLPEFRFLRSIFHPNIYADGRLCISILHNPGDDLTSGELASERWSPAQRVESVLISILSLLDDAEVSSPANVDAGVLLRNDKEAYAKRVKADVELSRKDIPEGFVMPTVELMSKDTKAPPSKEILLEDDDFWVDSGDEADSDLFEGSESDMEYDEDTQEDEEDEDEDEHKEDQKTKRWFLLFSNDHYILRGSAWKHKNIT